jgi:hypothetical protein
MSPQKFQNTLLKKRIIITAFLIFLLLEFSFEIGRDKAYGEEIMVRDVPFFHQRWQLD